MKYRFTRHALEEMARRGLDGAQVERVLDAPEQVVEQRSGRWALQSRVDFSDGVFLLRVIVDRAEDPPVVITVYRSSRIPKYWRQE